MASKVTFTYEDDTGEVTTITRYSVDEVFDIYEMTERFVEFLKGCGYCMSSIKKVINFENEDLNIVE